MDVSKLFKAAQEVFSTNPSIANEIQTSAEQLQQEGSSLNPNIKNFATTPEADDTEVHKITIQIEVPRDTNETELINAIIPDAEMLKSRKFKLKGYSFDER